MGYLCTGPVETTFVFSWHRGRDGKGTLQRSSLMCLRRLEKSQSLTLQCLHWGSPPRASSCLSKTLCVWLTGLAL